MLALVAALLAAPDVPRVEVSRREVTVTFPRAATPRGGWTVPPTPKFEWTQYGWWVTEPPQPSDFAGRPTLVAFEIRLDARRSRAFASLEAAVAESQAKRCFGGMLRLCFPTTWRATVQNDRVVLRLTDSAAIDSIFRLRPATIRLSRHVPPGTAWSMNVPIDYRDPQLPTLGSESTALEPRASMTETIHRNDWLGGGDFWITVGDSQSVTLSGVACNSEGGCGEGSNMGLGRFTIRNPRVATLQPRTAYERLARLHGAIEARTAEPPVQLIGRRPGVTTISFEEWQTPGLDAAGAARTPRRLEHSVHVIEPVRRIRIVSRMTHVPAGRALRFPVVAIDREGREHAGIPAELTLVGGGVPRIEADGPVTFQPGPATLVATFHQFADTLRLMADPPIRSP